MKLYKRNQLSTSGHTHIYTKSHPWIFNKGYQFRCHQDIYASDGIRLCGVVVNVVDCQLWGNQVQASSIPHFFFYKIYVFLTLQGLQEPLTKESHSQLSSKTLICKKEFFCSAACYNKNEAKDDVSNITEHTSKQTNYQIH